MTYPRPGYPPPALPTPPPTPWWKRLWFVAIVAAIVGGGIGAASASSSKQKDAAATTVTATTTSVSVSVLPGGTKTLRPTVIRTVATKFRTRTVTYTPAPKPGFTDGVYEVGSDINPGRYKTDNDNGDECYWKRSSDASGSHIIENNILEGPGYVNVNSGEYLEVSGGCEWRRA